MEPGLACGTPVVLLLIDEDFTRDKRVLASLEGYRTQRLCIVDCSEGNTGSDKAGIKCRFSFSGMVQALRQWRTLWRFLKSGQILRHASVTDGLLASLRIFQYSASLSVRLREVAGNISSIHAHDLACGIVGTRLAESFGVPLVYDAHEIGFNRNRRNSWLRMWLDMALEQYVVDRACEVIVVNQPIAHYYREVYGLPPGKIRVVNNNHFAPLNVHPASGETGSQQATIVYVGAGIKGRQLDVLGAAAAQLGLPVHAFFIGEIPEVALAYHWTLGVGDYGQALAGLVESSRCAMWCCVDDVCLSYRLALPNKFFQSLAALMPVIVAQDTYLADIVREHGVGYVFDGGNLKDIVEAMRSEDYFDKVVAVGTLRTALRLGKVEL